MSMVEKFKESKKTMMIKMEQANKLADEAAQGFIDEIESLAKDASEEDLRELLNNNDKEIDLDDKMAFIAMFAESHGDVGGIAIIGLRK